MVRPRTLLRLLSGTMICLCACSRGEESISSVQLCLVDNRGVAELKRLMRAVAAAEQLQFVDDSADAAHALGESGAGKLLHRDTALAIDLRIDGARGPGAMASNLGLPPYEVALGFGQGSDPGKARRLRNELVGALAKRWKLEPFPPGKGASAMASCEG